MSPFARLVLCGLCLTAILSADAAVVSVEVTKRSDLGTTGYEEIVGRLYYEIDPRSPGNVVIADVGLAPVNAAGRVRFSSDLRILKPKDPARANGAAWIEIPNRGGRASLNEWFVRHGFTLVNVGWEFDVPAGEDKLRLEVPEAREADGSALRGVVRAVFTPDKRLEEQLVTDLAEYPAVDPEGTESRLIVRTRAATPGGSEVPRDQWTLVGNRLRLEGGFEPGKTYEVSWLAEGPPVAGLGYAAIRDAVAWLKHDEGSLAPVEHAYAFGSSQCGRFLRDFLYLGFNSDEEDRIALDGVMAHVAGAGRLVLNERWSTPRAVAGYYTASYPFADTAQSDPVSGHREGILENPRVKHRPKVFYTNMAAEYWGAGRVAALTHTDVAGTADIEFPEEVRSYFFSGTSHGPAPFPPTSLVEGAPLANPVSASAAIYALRLAMHRWVAEDFAPPTSSYPKLADGTLTKVETVNFPAVPRMASPKTATAGGRVRNPQWPDGAGEGAELPLLVPQVDSDGNDLAGIRMPDVAVPLGTATGWVFRPEAMGSPHEFYLLRGAWIPFATTRAQRAGTRDPRPSLEERYASKEDYLAKVTKVLEDLVARRFLDESDLDPQLQQAGARWDWVVQEAPRKVLFLGNSITKHGPKPDIDWTGNWGMAASAEEKDYVHLVTAALAAKSGKAPEVLVKNIADFERAYADYDLANGMKEPIDFQADLVILAIGENVPGLKTPEDEATFDASVRKLLTLLKGGRQPKILVRSCFWGNAAKDEALRRACAAAGGIYVDLSELGKVEANYARSERPFKHAGVAKHPGDRGMAAIADAIVKALEE